MARGTADTADDRGRDIAGFGALEFAVSAARRIARSEMCRAGRVQARKAKSKWKIEPNATSKNPGDTEATKDRKAGNEIRKEENVSISSIDQTALPGTRPLVARSQYPHLPTIQTSLILIIPQRAVQRRQFPQLHPLELIILFRNIRRRLNDFLYELDGFLHLLLRIRGNHAMQVFFFVVVRSREFAFLDGTFATDRDFGARVCFQTLQGVSTGANEQTDEIDVPEFAGGDVEFILHLGGFLVIHRCSKRGVQAGRAVDEPVPFGFEAVAVSDFAGVGTFSVGAVDGGRRGGAFGFGRDDVVGAEFAGDFFEAEGDWKPSGERRAKRDARCCANGSTRGGNRGTKCASKRVATVQISTVKLNIDSKNIVINEIEIKSNATSSI